MRHVVCPEYGRLVVEEAPDPAPGPGEVVVGVHTAGVSFVDGLVVRGEYQVKPPTPFVPGTAVAGEVLGLGDGVDGLEVGTRVVGFSVNLGGYASHLVLPAAAVVPLPDAISYEVAATMVESYATMLFALTRRAPVQPGQTVLVLGAGGGIGRAAVDIARDLGAWVVAAASSQAKLDAAVAAGAHATVNYEADDLRTRVRELTGSGVDVVIDPVGGRLAEPALRTLRWFGRYLVVGFAGGSIPRLPLNHVLLQNRTVVGVDWGAWARQDPEGNRALVVALLQRVGAGELHPPAPTVYPIERVWDALTDLAERRAVGKIALAP